MRRYQKSLVAILVSLFTCVPVAGSDHADLVLRGGQIVTLDPGQPVARALAVNRDRIVLVGNNHEVNRLIGEKTEVIELQGKMAIPGFIEGHGHFISLGQSKTILNLTRAKNWMDIVQQVAAKAARTPHGHWIVGRGWHQAKWDQTPQPDIDGYPTHDRLSGVTTDHPVLLTHASGHMCMANALAMQQAGVTRATPDPPGGEIVKDTAGEPIGVFRETAQALIRRAQAAKHGQRTAAERRQDLLAEIELASQECLAHGVTSFQDAGSPFSTIRVFRDLAEQGRLKVRLWVMAGDDNQTLAQQLAAYRKIGLGGEHLTVRAIKRVIDGALGAHGAWLLSPYDDLPGSVGLNTTPIESLRQTAQLAARHGYQLCVHAIGDRANRETLDLFEEIFQQYPSDQSRRWRIEHAQHLHPDDIPRFGKLGVIASMQGIHCTSDAVFVARRLGMRRATEGAYVWQSLLQSGAVISNGTDTPVESVDPLKCFYASVTRKLPSGVAFFPDQRMTRMEALRSYTLDAAYAAFEEDVKGSLSLGKLADIVVLSRDIMTIPDEQILSTRVLYSIVGGKVLYRYDENGASGE